MKVTDQELAAALICSPTNKIAAQAVGLSERQLQERIRERSFRQLYAAMVNDLLSRASDAVCVRIVAAVETLSAIMTDEEQDAKIRIGAATALLQNGARIVGMARVSQAAEDAANDPFSFDALMGG